MRLLFVLFAVIRGDLVQLNSIYNEACELPLTKVDATTYYFCPPTDLSYCIVRIFGITYGFGDSTTTVDASSNVLSYGYGDDWGEPIEISTPEELQNLESGKSYKLINDIDLKGFDWKPYSFIGKLDGNGFVISNLSISTYCSDEPSYEHDVNVGMFTSCGGYITDIKMKNAKINVISEKQIMINVGILAGACDAFVNNCETEGDISVIVQNGAQSPLAPYIGGIVGNSESIRIYPRSSCINSCSFIGTIYFSVINSGEYCNAYCGAFQGFRGREVNCVAYSNFVINGVSYKGHSGSQVDAFDCQCYALDMYVPS